MTRSMDPVSRSVRIARSAARRAAPVVLGLFAVCVLVGCTAEMKARAYASGDRDAWQQPARVVEVLGITPGAHVADLGAGGGYFTFLLADAVGAGGRVYAVDVAEDMNARLREIAARDGYTNIDVVLARADALGLPAGGVDLLFTSNTYHHLSDRVAYFERAAEHLRPGGRLAVLDYKPGGGWFLGSHATDAAAIREELGEAGYRLLEEHDFIDRQHFLVFAAPDR